MKHSNSFSSHILAWIFPVLLIVPNIALAITERDPLLSKATDIVLPLGVYYLIMSLTSAVGRTVICCLPIMVLAAFQIVLLYLYGESIIAIDMFLNLVTTNPGEAGELLSNLLIAIIIVIVLYLPSIVWAILLMIKRSRCSVFTLRSLRLSGVLLTGLGLLLLVLAYIFCPSFTLRRSIFPVNVIANMVDAVNRTVDSARYHTTSSDYTFSPTLSHPRDIRELYVLVIGETSRADNWQLFGYDRPTTPRLSQRSDLIVWPKTLSESNTTHKSVPMLLSSLTSSNFGDSINFSKGICSAFNEAGYNTAFFSNQQRNHSYIDYFAYQAQTTDFIRDGHRDAHDGLLVDHLLDFINRSPADKLFVILHCYGSHFNYRERYEASDRIFVPDNASEANADNRPQLINAYDNTIVATDAMLDRLISVVDSIQIPAAVFYVSDHGEDIFDDERGRFLHASPTTTFTQVHVPFLAWFSQPYRELFPNIPTSLEQTKTLNVSSSRSLFPTVLSTAGISSPRIDHHADLTSSSYSEPQRIYLNDYNEAVTFDKAGFRYSDLKKAKYWNISLEAQY